MQVEKYDFPKPNVRRFVVTSESKEINYEVKGYERQDQRDTRRREGAA